jgi:hypothetical protein
MPSLVEVLSGTHPAHSPGVRVDLVPGVQFRYSGAGTSAPDLAPFPPIEGWGDAIAA